MDSKTIAFRAPLSTDDFLEELSRAEGVSKSTIIRVLINSEGPPAVVERVRVRHIVNELNRMALPTEGALAAVNDQKLMHAIGKLCSYTSAVMTCRFLGKDTEAEKLENDRAEVEAELYRAFGEAMKKHQA